MKEVKIGENCFLGAGTIIIPGIEIGDNVITGAGTIVIKNLEKNSVYVGNPCRKIRANVV